MSDRSMHGKVVVVTGASIGIGRAIAAAFGSEGAYVVANYEPGARQPDILSSNSIACAASVCDIEALARMFDDVGRRYGRIDILVNNAGIFPRCDPLELDEAHWDLTLNTNLKGAFFCSQFAAKSMRQNGGGCIVNITSDAAYKGARNGAAYAASKGGLLALTRSLARALARYNIRVNAIAPGVTDTAQAALTDQDRITRAAEIPLARVARPADIASAALFLAGEASGYITGQTLHVNGGSLMVS
jgi:NAD(P)-dependent dehydrogenase (short-subunit alcohol dehydrogenase family)